MKAFITATCLALLFLIITAALSCTRPIVPPKQPAITITTHQSYKSVESHVISRLKQPYKATVSILDTKTITSYSNPIGAAAIIKYKKGHKLLALTAYHVVALVDKNQVQVRLGSTNKWHRTMRLIRYDKTLDLALLEGVAPELKDGSQVNLASKDPLKGEELWAIGSPKQTDRNVTHGILSNIIHKEGKGKQYKLYRMDIDIFYGNSGGGIYNQQGELVCIAYKIQTYAADGILEYVAIPGGGLCFGIEHTKEFLARGK